MRRLALIAAAALGLVSAACRSKDSSSAGAKDQPGAAQPAPPGRPAVPPGWTLSDTSATAATAFEAGIDREVAHSGSASAFVRAAAPQGDARGGGLAQSIRAGEYRGKRVRLSAFVRTRDATKPTGAWLWMRADSLANGKGAPVAFYNTSMDRPITGTTDWARYEIVLNVPASATGIVYGVGLTGGGQAWVDDFQFEVVGSDVAVTGDFASIARYQAAQLAKMPEAERAATIEILTKNAIETSKAPPQPRNLGFEEVPPAR